jgi:hypothetical protein
LIRSAFIIYPILSVEIELIGPFLVPPSTRVVNTSFQSLLFCEQRTTCRQMTFDDVDCVFTLSSAWICDRRGGLRLALMEVQVLEL